MRKLNIPILLLTSWLMVNAIWGLTGSGTLISNWLDTFIGPGYFLVLGLFIFVVNYLFAQRKKDKKLSTLIWMLFAYTFGVLISEWARQALDPDNSILNRSFLLLPAIPMLFISMKFSADQRYPFKFGNWKVKSTFFGLGLFNWSGILIVCVLLISVPTWFLFQMGVQFEPIKSGTIWNSLPNIISLSVLNGFTEEFLFRGLIMIPLIHVLGVKYGIVYQAAFFGFHHLGASPEMISGIFMALILTLLGILFGRSVVSTKGLGWAIIFHASLDLATLSVQLGMP